MKRSGPPRLAQRLFNWFCGAAKVEDLRGDMEEIYDRNARLKGVFKARILYWRHVLSLIFSYAIRARKQNAAVAPLSGGSILPLVGSYFKVAARTLMRQKYFTAINVAGLAIGMSISLLFLTLFITVTDYDEFHANKDNIYRVTTLHDGKVFASAPGTLAEKINAEYPGVQTAIRIGRFLRSEEPRERQQIYVSGYFTDPSFLEAFSFPLEEGDPRTALTDPRSILITRSAATKIFGDDEPMGQTISMGAHGEFEIKGIIRDYPANCHMTFDVLGSYSTLEIDTTSAPYIQRRSEFANQYVYIWLRDDANPDALQDYLDLVSAKLYGPEESFRASFKLQALNDITPGPELENEIGPQWSYLSFAIAGGLAMLILLPACFNYTNISIARAMKRSREIGLRKTLGGVRKQIFFQFITETVVVTLLALIGACLIFFVIRNEFRSILVHAAALDLSLTPERILWFIAFAVVTGFVAGVFPAVHFSRLSPIDAIRNSPGTKALSGARIRKGLIVFQFALCLTFILSLIIFSKQYRYAMNFDLGFERANMLDVDLQQVKPEIFTAEFLKQPAVQSVSTSSGIMGHGVPGTWANLEGKTDSAEVYYMFVDGAFLENMDVELLAGRTFDVQEPVERSVIVNESFLKRFGFNGASEALGQQVQVGDKEMEIIGVARNFHYWQLHAPVAPFFFRYDPDKVRIANVKISTTDAQETLLSLERAWRKISDGRPFVANFLDDSTAGAFSMYLTLMKMFGFMGLLAVSISCLGLLGMVIFTAETKIKEVGIRKVMGASVWNVMFLLSRGYLKLMLIASAFAIPVAFGLEKFLSGMEHYRVSISPLDILMGLLLMFLLGVGTMASQTWRAASANPADTLKYE